MNRKQLEIKLSRLRTLDNPDISLEQYQLEGDFAAEILWKAYQNGNIKEKTVADLGCGNGILGIGALVLGAKFVYFLDADKNALSICKENLKDFDNFKVINSDVSDFNFKVDTVIMNPPFGVQNRKADKIFLETAMGFSNKVYSIHKIESKKFIEKMCSENGFIVEEIIPKTFFIKKTYKFHTKRRYSVDVGVWILGGNVI